MGMIMCNGIPYGDLSVEIHPDIYSEEEREVGVWIDGKPLYQKTLTCTADTSIGPNDWSTMPWDDEPTDIDFLVTGQNHQGDVPNSYATVRVAYTGGHLKMAALYSSTFSAGKRFTVWYTKSTDTAGSGQWTPSGIPAHHYSTNEQVVGTWIDGSTLYEKTFYSDMVIPYDSASAVTLNDTIPSNIEVVDIQAYLRGKNAGGNQIYQSDGGKWFNYYYEASDNKIYASQIFTSAGLSNCKTYFTIRYTKSST